MSKKIIAVMLSVSIILLSACRNTQSDQMQKATSPTQSAENITSSVLSPTPTLSPSPTLLPSITMTMPPEQTSDIQQKPITNDEIFQLFLSAMTELKAEVQFDVTDMTWKYGVENDLKNIYYEVLSNYPELKYTYDIETTVYDNTAICKFLYMPYKTGAYVSDMPSGSHTVGSLYDAKVMAQSMIDGTERMTIAITDPSLLVNDIQLALAQAGYGWIRYDLSRDGTEIIASAPVGKMLDECVSAINESFRLGGEILSDVITDDMTELEKIGALYDYIVGTVAYDFRYYSDRDNMPYESTVALGALRDKLAICGGYAQAFETLLDMLGIENYTVSGTSKGEYHMWNYVVLDGVGYYCDPTADRGGMRNHFMMTVDELTAQGTYSWNHEFFLKISNANK